MCKRAGRGHDEGGVKATGQAEIALECRACPQPDKNLPEEWEQGDPKLAFLFRLFLAGDANFRVKNNLVSSDARDPTLGQGWAYFVSKPEYLDHIKQFVDEEEVCGMNGVFDVLTDERSPELGQISSCSGFAAIFLKNLKNVKGLRTTGVVGVTCSRHGMWRGNGIGDLQKGERCVFVIFECLIVLTNSEERVM